jgi:hypothetical protein
MTKEWKQDRPKWCPHKDCVFQRRAVDSICAGQLSEPVAHDGIDNTHRVCVNQVHDPEAVRSLIFDLQVNANDLEWFRWVFDSIDGKATSWLSRRQGQGTE